MKTLIVQMVLVMSLIFVQKNVQGQIQADSLATVKTGDPAMAKRLKFGLGFGVNFVGALTLVCRRT